MVFKIICITLFPVILLQIQSSPDVISSVAALTGVGYGLLLFHSFIGEIRLGNWLKRFFSFLVGIIGIGISFGAPWLFIRMGLAHQIRSSQK